MIQRYVYNTLSLVILGLLFRIGLDFIYFIFILSLYLKCLLVLGAKVNDRPIRYLFGEVCHDFSLNERAEERKTTQCRAGLPVRNRIG